MPCALNMKDRVKNLKNCDSIINFDNMFFNPYKISVMPTNIVIVDFSFYVGHRKMLFSILISIPFVTCIQVIYIWNDFCFSLTTDFMFHFQAFCYSTVKKIECSFPESQCSSYFCNVTYIDQYTVRLDWVGCTMKKAHQSLSVGRL
jgi:hypothetical protein